jgi:hypothetical protein
MTSECSLLGGCILDMVEFSDASAVTSDAMVSSCGL